MESQLALDNQGIQWANRAEFVFLAIYSVEIVIRAIVLRLNAFSVSA